MISLVAFLGNYGKEYKDTRHNAAWIFAEQLPFASVLSWQSKFKGEYTALDSAFLISQAQRYEMSIPPQAETGNRRIYFVKPMTYMNLSGESIGEIARFYKIQPAEILIVHDELELAPGTVSLKWSGGLGGHNGLRSAKTVLGTADFWRLRLGIGRPDHKDVAGYVLSSFTSDEQILLSRTFPAVSQLLFNILLTPPEQYLKQWSKRAVVQLSAGAP